MKNLNEINEDNARHICNLAGEPFISFRKVLHQKEKDMGLEILISTTTTMDHADKCDSYIRIYKNGTIELLRNSGGAGIGNPNGDLLKKKRLKVTPIKDYLKSEGFDLKPKKCKEKGCDGNVDLDKQVPIQTGCSSFSMAYCCDKCGRLHWLGEKGVIGVKNRQGKNAFVINGGLVNK